MRSLIEDGDDSGATLPRRVDGVFALRYDSAVFDHGLLMRRRDFRCPRRAANARRHHVCGGRRAGAGAGAGVGAGASAGAGPGARTGIGDTDAPRRLAGRG
jgi:hypothetical protein